MQHTQAAAAEIIHKKKQAILSRLEAIDNYADEYLIPAIEEKITDVNNQKIKLEQSKIQVDVHEVTQELIQSGGHIDVPYELATLAYPIYISYLKALRQFGYVVTAIRVHKDTVHKLFNDVDNLHTELSKNNPFPSQSQSQETLKTLASIAIKLESYRNELSNQIDMLNEEMLRLANKYRLDAEFKAGIDKQLAQLAENERNELLQWTEPYIDYLTTSKVDLYDTLSAAIATLNIDVQNKNVLDLRA